MAIKEYIFGKVEVFDDIDGCAWDQVHDEMMPIISLYKDDSITDININRYDEIWIYKNGVPQKADCSFGSESSLNSWVSQIATVLKQPYGKNASYKDGDIVEPILDARFPDGSRIMATSPLISPQGTTVSLRKAPKEFLGKDDFLKSEMFNEDMLEYLIQMILERKTFLVAGNTGSGKTSLLRFLASYIDKNERVITAEDTQELHINRYFPLGVALESPHRNDINSDLPKLITATMRAQPDRVWVGEIRTAEAIAAFYLACTSGTTGNASTIHSKTPIGAFNKMQWLISSQLNVDFDVAGSLVKSEIDVVIQCRRDYRFGRKITDIVEVKDGVPVTIFSYSTKDKCFKKY